MTNRKIGPNRGILNFILSDNLNHLFKRYPLKSMKIKGMKITIHMTKYFKRLCEVILSIFLLLTSCLLKSRKTCLNFFYFPLPSNCFDHLFTSSIAVDREKDIQLFDMLIFKIFIFKGFVNCCYSTK